MRTRKREVFALSSLLLAFALTLPVASEDQLEYVIIGNSVGTWWGPNYAKLLEADLHANIRLHNYYVPNQHAADLLNKVRDDKLMRDNIQRADIITIGIGSADISDAILLYGPEGLGPRGEDQMQIALQIDQSKIAYDAILSEIDKLTAESHPIIRTMDIPCPYVAKYEKLGVYTQIRDYWISFNDCIAEVAEKHNVPDAKVFRAMNGIAGNDDPTEKMLIASDGKHPSSKGLQLIAEEVRKLGYNRNH
jgi:lysophospholipase L1-like esterase